MGLGCLDGNRTEGGPAALSAAPHTELLAGPAARWPVAGKRSSPFLRRRLDLTAIGAPCLCGDLRVIVPLRSPTAL